MIDQQVRHIGFVTVVWIYITVFGMFLNLPYIWKIAMDIKKKHWSLNPMPIAFHVCLSS